MRRSDRAPAALFVAARASSRPMPPRGLTGCQRQRTRPSFGHVAILQALISLITKSAGKILNAIFGWAVLALFGQTSPKEQTMLSAVVAAAAAWPLLLLGIVVPRVTV